MLLVRFDCFPNYFLAVVFAVIVAVVLVADVFPVVAVALGSLVALDLVASYYVETRRPKSNISNREHISDKHKSHNYSKNNSKGIVKYKTHLDQQMLHREQHQIMTIIT